MRRTGVSVAASLARPPLNGSIVGHLGTAMLTESTRRKFLQFCNGEIDAERFEAWVCADEELESQLGHGAHLDLIAADYRGRDAAATRDRCAALLEQHHPGNLVRYRIRSILQRMLDDQGAVIPGLRELVRLRHDGNEDIPIEFVGFDSDLDGLPSPEHYHLWDPAFLAEIRGRNEPYLRSILRSCRELLGRLRRGHPDDV
ncbi:MAG TPA: hypothetical protein VIF57_17340 [Polyangia bacterium]|jgi:hypothetical protein